MLNCRVNVNITSRLPSPLPRKKKINLCFLFQTPGSLSTICSVALYSNECWNLTKQIFASSNERESVNQNVS